MPSAGAGTLIYCDPPYYVKGRDLYYDYYEPDDHERVARFVTREIVRQKWIVSYDNVKQVRDLYAGCERMKYRIGYSARSSRQGAEVMFFSDSLKVPHLVGPIRVIRERGSSGTRDVLRPHRLDRLQAPAFHGSGRRNAPRNGSKKSVSIVD